MQVGECSISQKHISRTQKTIFNSRLIPAGPLPSSKSCIAWVQTIGGLDFFFQSLLFKVKSTNALSFYGSKMILDLQIILFEYQMF